MVDFFCLTWYVQDGFSAGNKCCLVHCFGKTVNNTQVQVTAPFHPYFYVEGKKDGAFASTLRDGMRMGNADPNHLIAQECCTTEKYSFLGFTNTKKTVTKLRFLTKKAFTTAKKLLAQREVLYESNVDVDLQFLHETGLKSVGWMSVPEGCLVSTTADSLHFYCTGAQLHNVDSSSTTPCVLASYDIEAFSESNSFPDPEKASDVVFMIATTFQLLGSDAPFEQHLVVIDDCDEDGDTPQLKVERARDERQLIDMWASRLLKNKTDVLIAYNNFGFDDRYLDTRYRRGYTHLAPWEGGIPLSRLVRRNAPERAWIKQKRSEFAGMGDSKIMVTAGIWNLDLLVIIKQQHQLENNSLDSVSEHFLQDHKIDLPAKEMFRMYSEGRRGQRPAFITEIGRYCLKDTVLPLRLVHKLNVIPSMMEMAAATTVPIDFLLQRGQSVRCFSQIVKKMHNYDIICPSVMYTGQGAYEGATVIEPTKGAYWGPIAVCDYASLYPSIIRSNTLCPSRLVLDSAYGDVAGVKYRDVQVAEQTYSYAVDSDPAVTELPPAVLPVLLEELALLRKQANAAKDAATDPWQKKLLDAKQKAIKVSMNSVYGVFGAARGFLTCQPLASSVTSIGRQMINTTKRMIEERFPGTEVIYGDSVAAYTPLLVKVGSDIKVLTIEELGDDQNSCWVARNDGKEFKTVRNIHAWSERGWTEIHQIVRHRLAPGKRLVRVVTGSGYVDVTTDHSLLRADGVEVRPADLCIGEQLLHAPFYVNGDAANVLYSCFLDTPADSQKAAAIKALLTRTDSACMAVEQIAFLPRDSSMVYDLTTDNHHFQAGVGDIIVHNTDSVMVKFPGNDMRQAFQWGAQAAVMMTNHFSHPVKLELEKVFNPYLLFAKKQYAGLQYNSPDTEPVLNVKGLQVVRRDSCRFVKEACWRVLNALLYDKDVDAAKQLALRDAAALLANQIDPQLLYLSRKLNSEYKNSNLAQVRVRDKMQKRVREGTSQTAAPQPGDRVKFVYSTVSNKKAKAGDKAEDPAWLIERYPDSWKAKIDVEYYFTNCFSNPVLNVLTLVDPAAETLFKEVFLKYTLKRDGQNQITRFFQPITKSVS